MDRAGGERRGRAWSKSPQRAAYEKSCPVPARGGDAASAWRATLTSNSTFLSTAVTGFKCFEAPRGPWPALSALRRRRCPRSAVPRQQRGSAQDTLIIPTGAGRPPEAAGPPSRSPNERAESPNPSTPPMLSRRETKRARRPRRPKIATARPQTQTTVQSQTLFFNPRFNPKPKSGPLRSNGPLDPVPFCHPDLASHVWITAGNATVC